MSIPSTLLLIRHAETDSAGTFCGHADPPVNASGRMQIANLLEELAAHNIDVVYTSDLQRARTTAEAIVVRHAAPLHVCTGLREINFGDWESRAWAEVERTDPDYAARWVADFPRLPAPHGEAFSAFEERVLRAFDSICAAEERAAVVTHAGVLRVILTRRYGLHDELAWSMTKAYCEILVHPLEGARLKV